MSTITKQWLQQTIAEMEEYRDLFPGDLDDNHGKVLSALRMALASLEAEAVADVVAWSSPNEERTCDVRLRRHDINPGPLYTAPEAPVSVPDENGLFPCPFCGGRPEEDAGGCSEYDGHEHQDYSINCKSCGAEVYCAVGSFEKADIPCSCHHNAREVCVEKWNRRAAMLQSADGNSPVIPDGWVACSERMPHIGVPVITCCGDVVQYAAYAWDGKEWQDWYEEYDKLPANTFTHWHPRPAAPQQEA